MELILFARGLGIGFSIAAPVGPIGILCIRRTISDGARVGIACGLGAATADAVYGCIAGFGLTALSGLWVSQQAWLRLVGGVFLCYLGIRTFLSRPSAGTGSATGRGVAGAYGTTFFLTLTNPMTILSFAAVFAGLGLGQGAADYLGAVSLVTGVFLGSTAWWLMLSGAVSWVRGRLSERHLRWINRTAGAVIGGFGVFALAGLRT
jgi:threonine/homoserine/homoserine lactone efflux protein